eukprot:7098253-Heterocapsa_arctica.AAC.1
MVRDSPWGSTGLGGCPKRDNEDKDSVEGTLVVAGRHAMDPSLERHKVALTMWKDLADVEGNGDW